MTHPQNHSEDVFKSQEGFEQMVKERLRQAVRVALISALEEEVTALIGARPFIYSFPNCSALIRQKRDYFSAKRK